MLTWIAENGGTIVVLLLLAGILYAVIRKMLRDRKHGSACGCDCAHCGHCAHADPAGSCRQK